MQLKGETPFYTKTAYLLIIIISVGYLAILGKEILSPLIFSFLFSILLLPLASFLEVKVKVPRSVGSLLAVLTMVAIIALVLYLVGSQFTNLASDWPQFKLQLAVSLEGLQNWIADKFNIDAAKQLSYVNDATSKLLNSGTAIVGATVISLSSILLFLVFTFIYTFFFLLYRRLIFKFLIAVFKNENSNTVYEIVERVQVIIRKYIIGLLFQMVIVSFVCYVAFWALGIKYAALLGLITGLFNIIPYIGIFTALVVSSLITFATAATASKVLLVVLVIVIMHLIDSNIILPVVVGSQVRINALITVLGVFIGEMMWGISGMFLSIPVIAVIKIIFDRIETLKPWGMLLGDEEKPKKLKSKTIHPEDR